jgi:hypothetical protein
MAINLEILSEKNWKDYTKELALERYPVGTLVKYYSLYTYVFGKVSSISDKGIVCVKCGTLPLEKVTDSSSVEGTFWYKPKGFIEGNEFDEESYSKSRRFKPFYNSKEGRIGAKNNDIIWGIETLKMEENGLVKIVKFTP